MCVLACFAARSVSDTSNPLTWNLRGNPAHTHTHTHTHTNKQTNTRTGPDIYVRTQEQLHAARKWLQSSPNPHQAASTFVRVASDTLMCVEASIKVGYVLCTYCIQSTHCNALPRTHCSALQRTHCSALQRTHYNVLQSKHCNALQRTHCSAFGCKKLGSGNAKKLFVVWLPVCP